MADHGRDEGPLRCFINDRTFMFAALTTTVPSDFSCLDCKKNKQYEALPRCDTLTDEKKRHFTLTILRVKCHKSSDQKSSTTSGDNHSAINFFLVRLRQNSDYEHFSGAILQLNMQISLIIWRNEGQKVIRHPWSGSQCNLSLLNTAGKKGVFG